MMIVVVIGIIVGDGRRRMFRLFSIGLILFVLYMTFTCIRFGMYRFKRLRIGCCCSIRKIVIIGTVWMRGRGMLLLCSSSVTMGRRGWMIISLTPSSRRDTFFTTRVPSCERISELEYVCYFHHHHYYSYCCVVVETKENDRHSDR